MAKPNELKKIPYKPPFYKNRNLNFTVMPTISVFLPLYRFVLLLLRLALLNKSL